MVGVCIQEKSRFPDPDEHTRSKAILEAAMQDHLLLRSELSLQTL